MASTLSRHLQRQETASIPIIPRQSIKADDSYIRKAAIRYKVPYITTTAAAKGIAGIK